MTKGTLTLLCTIIATVIAVLGYLESNSKQVIVVNPPVIGGGATEPRSGGADTLSPAEAEEQHQIQLENLRRENELESLRLQQERDRLDRERELERERTRLEEEKRERERRRHLRDVRAAEEAAAAAEREQARRKINLSGRWALTNQIGIYTFVFQQSGNAVTLQEFDPMGNMVGEGSGTIQNRSVSLNITEMVFFNTVQIQASLELSQDGRRLSGTMVSPISFVQATLFRQ